jgi:hypothetical protein
VASSVPVVNVAVDWNNNGSFTDSGDDVTSRTLSRDQITISVGRDQVRAFSPTTPGQAAFSLNNISKDYSPDFGGSPLTGNVVSGRPVRIQANQDATTYILYRGYTDGFTVLPAKADRSVQITCVDALNRFSQVTLSTALFFSVRTGAAISAILDGIGWTGGRDLDVGASIIRYWWEEGTDALTALGKVLGAEGPPALAYVDTNGGFVFRDRHHRLRNAVSTASQAVLSNGGFTESAAGAILNANPAFEAGIANWTAQNSATLASSSAQAHGGTKSMSITPNGVASGPGGLSEQVPANPGPVYTGTAWFFSASSWATGVNVQLNWYTSGHGYISTTTPAATPLSAATWTQATVTGTAPSNAAFAQLVVSASGTPGAGQVFFADDAQLTTVGFVSYSEPNTYDDGSRDIVNTIVLQLPERNPSPNNPSVVWEDAAQPLTVPLNEDPTIVFKTTDNVFVPSGGTTTILVVANDPFQDAQVPVAGTGFAQLSGTTTASLSRTSGQSTTITLTDSGGGSWIGSLILRARPVTAGRVYQVSAADATSVAAYGTRALPSGVDMSWCSAQDAAAVTSLILTQYKQRRPIVTFPVRNANSTRLTQMLLRDISDRVTVTDTQTGMNADCFIENLKYTMGEGGRFMETQFGCEKAPAAITTPWTFGTDVFGTGVFGL